ncbi:MAG: hypothetical protein GX221_08790 [Candidatus Riflebacteria bacterium]|nr:hypothetical protein [Candidatus Riflebacteria bacterium]
MRQQKRYAFPAFGNSKSGFILFIVLGCIIILGLMAFAFNFLARGKAHETNELMQYQRINKAAHSLLSSVMYKISHDLHYGEEAQKEKLMEAFKSGESSKLNEYLRDLEPVLRDTAKVIFTNGHAQLEVKDFDSSTYKLKGEIQKGELPSSGGTFFTWEGVGDFTVTLDIKVDRTSVSCAEKRKFKVVSTFPPFITQFAFFVKDYNGLGTKSNTGAGPLTVVSNVQAPDPSEYPDAWKNGSGWVYFGNATGSNLVKLMRDDVSQSVFTYKDATQKQSTRIDLSGISGLGAYRDFSLKQADWGYLTSFAPGSSWTSILGNDIYGSERKSSALRLFASSGSAPGEATPTRVFGNVVDWYYRVVYLIYNNEIVAALRSMKDTTLLSEAKGHYPELADPSPLDPPDSAQDFSGYTNIIYKSTDSLPVSVYLSPNGNAFANKAEDEYRDMNGFFSALLGNLKDGKFNEILDRYRKFMSGIYEPRNPSEFVFYDVVYNRMAQYGSGSPEGLSYPPRLEYLPKRDDAAFFPAAYAGELQGKMRFDISEIKGNQTPSFTDLESGTAEAMEARVCYDFSSNPSAIKTFFLDGSGKIALNGLVVSLPDAKPLEKMGLSTPGAFVLTSGGTVNVSLFESAAPGVALFVGNSFNVNGFSNAYFIAQNNGGTVNLSDEANILGCAVDTFNPDNIKKSQIGYSPRLSMFSDESIVPNVAVAIGPKAE